MDSIDYSATKDLIIFTCFMIAVIVTALVDIKKG